MQNHYPIKPIKAYVFKNFLTDDHNDKSNFFIECEIIGLCLYEGEAITFDIVLNDGSIFNYIPPHKIKHDISTHFSIGLSNLVYHNCKSMEITVSYMDALKNIKLAYCKKDDSWHKVVEYVLTVDWYKDNDLLNLVKLENGYFAFLPNHKLKMNEERSFKKYSKIRNTFKV